jgi:hypothetical protein
LLGLLSEEDFAAFTNLAVIDASAHSQAGVDAPPTLSRNAACASS